MTLLPRLYFSYSQFMVYDQSVKLPGCAWANAHTAQGFARRGSTANFNTLLEFGYADVGVIQGAFAPQKEYSRVIAVPFLITSGKVIVEGPEETEPERNIALPQGNYRLVAAQIITGGEEEVIDLFFESVSQVLERSSILVADAALAPPEILIESASIAGES